MRLSYANVVSTLALVLALGGTGAYAAEKIDGKDLKNDSVTGKKLKNGTVTSKDLAGDVGTRGPAGPQGPAGPVGAKPLSFAVDSTLGSGSSSQPLGQFDGLSLSAQCTRPGGGGDLYYIADLSATSGSAAQLDTMNVQHSGASVAPALTHGQVAAGSLGRLAMTSSIKALTAVTTFSWRDGSGTYTGSIVSDYVQASDTCHYFGWILHG
jgi:hypothetical protein